MEDYKKTIMIVDDEKMIINLLSHNLKKEGYNVIEAYDGVSAVDMALEQRPDLILLDIMIPRLDGLSVCKRIKNWKQAKCLSRGYIIIYSDSGILASHQND